VLPPVLVVPPWADVPPLLSAPPVPEFPPVAVVPAWPDVPAVPEVLPVEEGAGLSEEQALPRSESAVTSESTARMPVMKVLNACRSTSTNANPGSLIAFAHQRNTSLRPHRSGELRVEVPALDLRVGGAFDHVMTALGRLHTRMTIDFLAGVEP
jgi:hypothetical protein